MMAHNAEPEPAVLRTSSADLELIQFLVGAFVVSWCVGGLGVLLLGELGLGLGALCPGLVALWLTRRRSGTVRPLLQHITRWRIRWVWYAVAIGLPVLVQMLAWIIVRAAGAAWGTATHAPEPVGVVMFFLVAVLLFGGPEEPGWRGYALPRLQTRFHALGASLLLGAIWAIWHAPLWFIPDLFFAELSYPVYAAQIIGMTVVYTWLFNSTGGSVLLAMILHASTNTFQQFVPMSATAELAMAGVWVAFAAILLLMHGPRNLARTPRIDRGLAQMPYAPTRHEARQPVETTGSS
jgi:uncharacterized protein